MPRELYQPELAELPISLRQPQDLLPPACSPLLGDNNPYGSIKHYFPGEEHLQHLVSPGRLAFGSAPLPDIHAMVRMRTATSYQELQACLQRSLVAAPSPGAAAADAPNA